MNRKEFIEALKRETVDKDIKWTLGPENSGIRCHYDKNYHCPITLVCATVKFKSYQVYQFFSAGKTLGIKDELSKIIVVASDGELTDQEELRDELLSVCGIS